MKILAIRGRNLTSLAGDFALELDRPPLDQVGLFAITGATGAGKSTLLDAMCLALFDGTPRLEQGGGVLVGRASEDKKARLKDTDARGVLRRGAVEGFAEVDFLGRDGRRYRANWSVARAHKRVDGAIQLARMSLVDVVSQKVFGSTKSEVLEAIQDKLGLSFEQFRRSALLAQGEFAAFLRAKEKDRAELLERMTGTEVYSRLSLAAHERKQQVQKTLAELERGVEAISLLSEEELTQVRGELAREEAALAGARREGERAEQAVRWYQARTEFAAQERGAEEERGRAGQALASAEPRRLEWERVRAAEDLRTPMSAVDEATKSLEARDAELRARRGEEAAAREAERASEAAGREAEARRDAAVKAEEAARPELAAAEALDADIKHAQEQARDAVRQREEALEDEQRARAALALLSDQETAARKRVEELLAWRDKRGPVEPVAREWARWDMELKRYQQQARQEASARGLLVQTEALLAPGLAEAERCGQARRVASEALVQAEAETARAESARDPAAEAEYGPRRDALGARQERLKELESVRGDVAASVLAEHQAARDVEGAQREQAAATAEALAARTRCQELDTTLKEARRAFDRARDALDLTARRAELREGEPCPLCGATEHPLARAEEPLVGLVEEARGRVTALEGELQRETRTESAATARAEGAGQRMARAEEARATAAKQRAARCEHWRHLREQLGDPLVPGSGEAAEAEAWLAAALTDVRARVEHLRAEEVQAEKQARVAREARLRLDKARVSAESAEAVWRDADQAAKKTQDTRERHQRDAEQAAAGLRDLKDALATAFAKWPQWDKDLSTDAGAFHARCLKAVTEWNAKDAEWRQAELDVRNAAEALGPAKARVELLHTQAETRVQATRERDEALARLRATRNGWWGGRATADVRAALRQELETATQAAESRRDITTRAAQAAAVALTRVESAAAARDLASTTRQRAEATLDARLSERSLSRETARELLARGPQWCADEQRALEQLQRAHEKALLLVEERRRQRLQHESSAPPTLAEPEAVSARAQSLADTEARMRAVATLESQLRHDDTARRGRVEQLRLLEETRRQSNVWLSLSDLIGSHDGKTFKIFAQSLTLDALLHYANAHLEELAPRYRLLRAPESNLDLQVEDRDMGDEVRAVSSLSGGESFLVSLALALGLASLSSETTQVDTLFIDEGFGTLDPDTLEVALATLDALQATGRQVGIISHVSGLAERIGVQVRVVKQGAGRSRLQVVGEGGLGSGLAATVRRSASVG